MNRLKIVTVCGAALLIAAAVGAVVAPRDHRQPLPTPDVPEAVPTAEVRVKAVERNVETLDPCNVEAVKFLSRKPRRAATEFGILLPETA